jgi:hypothetical protein
VYYRWEGSVGLVESNLSEMNSRVNHWTDFLTECPRRKIKFFRGRPNLPDAPEVEKVRATTAGQALHDTCLYLGTHLGFEVKKQGYLFRQLEPKAFIVQDDGVPAFYVSQAFDDNVGKFRRGDPIIMLEGVLDVEVFSEVSGYPYVMGYLTSSVPHNLAMMMALLTDRVILIPDNDAGAKKNWGAANLPHSIAFLKKFGLTADVLQFEDFKDFGEAWPMKDLHHMVRARVGAKL